ncbi:MAG: hypothetical protein KJ811_02095, partial [Candidatus Margulisbacteria bacterium]|nr:hypothetical protein [Candidatus Margulisiibacteriota bacterium]
MTNVKCQIKVLLYKIIIPFPLLYNIIIVAGSRLLVGAFVIFNLTLVITAETAAAPSPLWAKSGIVINDTLGNSPEQKPKIISDPAGGYILVWEDGRGGATNVYAQKLSEASTPLWTNMGIAVSQSPKNQNSPQVISDQSGGAIIVWQDFRSDKADIFAQKINSSGQLVWGNVGLPICTEKSGQFSPQITSDGAGGAIIVWHDYRSGKGEDIFAQKIDSKGNLLWQQDGLPISTAASTQWYPQISGDGQGGAIIVWTDGRAGAADNNIYAQHISTSGQTIWEKDGIPICSAPKNQERPVILGVSGGAIIAWEDSRFNNLDIFAQKITNDGNPGWEKDGRRICQASGQQEKPTLCPDGNEGVIIAWTDYRAPASDIYAQRVQDSGKILWAE